MSTSGAAATLREALNNRLNRGKSQKSLRTYAIFVDYSKCFDSVNRKLLFEKLQRLVIPYGFCHILEEISNNVKCYIKSGSHMTQPYTTTTGVLQGCSLSSILFCLFVSDLPQSLLKVGPKIKGTLFQLYPVCRRFGDTGSN